MTHQSIVFADRPSLEEISFEDLCKVAEDPGASEATAAPGSWSPEAENAAIRNARQGDPRGFQMLYDNYSAYVYHRCLRLTGDPGIAEDLRQDVFFQVWKGISKFRGDSKFKTWLYRVTTNMAYMHLRRTQCRPQLEEYSPQAKDIETREEQLSSRLLHLEDHLLAHQIVSVLAPKHRAVLMLHDLNGYKHAEIAALLGIPCGTSKSILFRARREVRIALQRPWRRSASARREGRKPRLPMASRSLRQGTGCPRRAGAFDRGQAGHRWKPD